MAKSRAMMWLKLVSIAATAITLLYLMFAPVTSVSVTLDVPDGMTKESMPAVITGITWVANALSAIIGALVIGAAVWLARRVIRHHQRER